MDRFIRYICVSTVGAGLLFGVAGCYHHHHDDDWDHDRDWHEHHDHWDHDRDYDHDRHDEIYR